MSREASAGRGGRGEINVASVEEGLIMRNWATLSVRVSISVLLHHASHPTPCDATIMAPMRVRLAFQ